MILLGFFKKVNADSIVSQYFFGRVVLIGNFENAIFLCGECMLMQFATVLEVNGFIRTFKRYPDNLAKQVIKYNHLDFHTTAPIPDIPPNQRLTCIPLLLEHECRIPSFMSQSLDKSCLVSFTQSE
jgi:hypothetical protein